MRLLPSSLLGRFFLKTFLWLPFWFAIWFALAGPVSVPALWISEFVLNTLHAGLVEQVEGWGRQIRFVSTLVVEAPDGDGLREAQLIAAVNPLIYSWNLPVLLALLFAADNRFFSIVRLIAGCVALFFFHAWGVTFDVLRTLALQGGEDVRQSLGWSGWQLEAIGLAYQFGYLMLPFIGVATLWLLLNKPMLRALVEDERGG